MSLPQTIKRAVLSLLGKDSGQFPTAQAHYNNKAGDVELWFPYGLCANPPRGSLMLMFNVMGQEENRAGFANYPQRRFKNLKEWEVQVGNYDTEAYIKFDNQGNIHVKTPHTSGNVYVESENSEVHITAAEKVYVEAENSHVIVTSGQTIRLEASRIELAATTSIKWDVGGRGYTYYPTHTDSWTEGSVDGNSYPIDAPEHDDGVDPAS